MCITIQGEVGYHRNGRLTIQTKFLENDYTFLDNLVWHIEIPDGNAYKITLTDAKDIDSKWNSITSIHTNDSIEARVDLATIVREYTELNEEAIDALKELIMQVWCEPTLAKQMLLLHSMLHREE